MLSQVRKFGLEYYDLPTMLWNVSVFLKVLTLNIYSKHKTGIPIYFYIITIAAFMCYFYMYVGCMLWFVFIKAPETGEVLPAVVVLSVGIYSEIGTLKLLYMRLYIGKIRKLTQVFLDLDAQMDKDSRLSVNVLKYMRDVKKRAILYWTVIMSNGILYILKLVVSPGLEPQYELTNYEIALVIMAVSVFLICYIAANVTAYQIVIIGYAEAQMLALSTELGHVWIDAEEHYQALAEHDTVNVKINNIYLKNKIINEQVSQSLKEIIKQHAVVKNLMAQVEDVSRGPIAIGLSLLILGLILSLLAGLENTYMQLPFCFMQVGIDCFIGQRVMDAGEIFEQAVYDCKWENFDKFNMKTVLVMLQVSQKSMAISAGGVTKMNFMCMMAAMKATYSTYTALGSIMK